MNLLKDKDVFKSGETKKLTIDNDTKVYDVYKIKIDKLYYNDQNDRIATWISEYKQNNNIEKIDTSNKEEYNNIIHNFITKSNENALKKTQNNIQAIGQEEPGVVLVDGRIVDGNRRFTCLRNIQATSKKTQYFHAVILDKDIVDDAKEIKMLELHLQHGKDKPVDYNPIDRLVGIYNDIVKNKLLTEEEYADVLDCKLGDILKEVRIAKLMAEFLEFIDSPEKFHIARDLDLNGPLVELESILKKVKDDYKKEDIKSISFANLIMKTDGDMTRYIRKMGGIIKNKRYSDEYVEEQLDLAGEVCDIISEYDNIDEKVINEKIRVNEDLKEKFEDSTEKWKVKSDSNETKKRPKQKIEKAKNELEGIDTNVFKKLDKVKKEEIRELLDLIGDIVEEIRGRLDV